MKYYMSLDDIVEVEDETEEGRREHARQIFMELLQAGLSNIVLVDIEDNLDSF